MGLRDKNKTDRQLRILKAAADLFRRKSYEAAKIEEIADASEVSVGTIYNYYKNKGDILVAVVSMEVNEVLLAGEKILTCPPRDARKAVNALVGAYVNHSLHYLSKDMWRQAMAISTQQPRSPFGLRYAQLDQNLTDQVCRLMTKLKKMGTLQQTSIPQLLGEVIFNNTNMMFATFVKDERMSHRSLTSRLRSQNRAILAAHQRS